MSTKGPASYTDGLIENMIKVEVQKQTRRIRKQLAAANRRLKTFDRDKAVLEKEKTQVEKLTAEAKKVFASVKDRAFKEVKTKTTAKLREIEKMDEQLRQAFARLNKFIEDVEKIRTRPISEIMRDPIRGQFSTGNFTYSSVGQTVKALRKRLGNLEKEIKEDELIEQVKGK
jgi:hypothetical protein